MRQVWEAVDGEIVKDRQEAIERDGAFKSWAVPNWVTEEVGPRHLAVQLPDYALEFGSFAGTIPAGHTWWLRRDSRRRTQALLEWSENATGFILNGLRFKGRYSFIRFARRPARLAPVSSEK